MYRRLIHSSLAVLAVASAAVLVTSVAPAAGGVARNGSFKTPSGNIVCGHSVPPDTRDTAVGCGIQSGLKPTPRNTCTDLDYSGKRMSLRASGRAVIDLCAGDPGPFLLTATAPVLGYGSSWRGGGITCTSRRAGLTCRNGSGHGFFMSRANSYRF
jgi:hypothetical protein